MPKTVLLLPPSRGSPRSCRIPCAVHRDRLTLELALEAFLAAFAPVVTVATRACIAACVLPMTAVIAMTLPLTAFEPNRLQGRIGFGSSTVTSSVSPSFVQRSAAGLSDVSTAEIGNPEPWSAFGLRFRRGFDCGHFGDSGSGLVFIGFGISNLIGLSPQIRTNGVATLRDGRGCCLLYRL